MKKIAIISARSGSKGVKDKNIRALAGKPLMAYSIEAALGSGLFDKVVVSTDSEEYAKIARAHGAEVPFLRSAETASDTASGWDVIKEVLRNYKEMFGEEFDMFTLLQPTSPLRTAEDVKKAYEIFVKNDADAVVSVCEMEHSPYWCNTLPADHCMNGFLDRANDLPRQKLKTHYRLNGALYMVRVAPFMQGADIYNEKSYAYIMDTLISIDIDSELDFKLAETIIAAQAEK